MASKNYKDILKEVQAETKTTDRDMPNTPFIQILQLEKLEVISILLAKILEKK